MLTVKTEWIEIAEVNPPQLPNMSHLRLSGQWDHVLITDNIFGKIRVSPYSFAARITHDVPTVHPTVVVSGRDRNILAIESEVRGALGNGVDSFFVVAGDTFPHVDHLSHHYEIVDHLRSLQQAMPAFEVGMPTRFRRWQLRQRSELGAQFFVAGPVMDADTAAANLSVLGLEQGDPPVFLAVIPPFSLRWVEKAEAFGAVPISEGLRRLLADLPDGRLRQLGWSHARQAADLAKEAGCAGVVLMGLGFDTLVNESRTAWDEI